MAKRQRLTDDEITAQIAQLKGWRFQDGKLHREFEFSNFAKAFGFMTSVAIVAEKMDHHPEWSNVYNRVVVDLSTHDAGGVTDFDFRLAQAIDALAG